ncbi:Cof-type HAD-IIB family hydrolase [Lactobacillus sp. ESL0684]|uniref:Cof-type HAD-IIB family hydrolase n=1 Tax=Lactobacillus sp. ESL0684 TaxID=2983213 RepID=UPI0023F7CF01|nr:Cof-type HAD-IIB family hydrolase [Lactobacillus sp. ESL0684]WEV43066.1 Cof-type HAD-IIB family hydrolase [Lactobacillus sp. ESL0684]
MGIKLIAVDLDGTLLTSNNEILPETEKLLKQANEQGIKVVLATGRPLSGVMRYSEQLSLAGKADQYNIVFNGAVIQNLAGKVVMDQKMNYHDFTNMIRLQRLAHVNLHFETPDCFWCCDRDLAASLALNAATTNNMIKVRPVEEIPQDFSFNKVGLTMIDDLQEMDKLWQNLPDWVFAKYDVVRSFPEIIELNLKNASKGNALLQLAARLQIAPNQVMVFGDQGNDVSMFANPDFKKIAMGNAIEAIKDSADYVTDDNDHNGIAKALKKFVL